MIGFWGYLFNFLSSLFSIVAGIVGLIIAYKKPGKNEQRIISFIASVLIGIGIVFFVGKFFVDNQKKQYMEFENRIVMLENNIVIRNVEIDKMTKTIEEKDAYIQRINEYKNQTIRFIEPIIGKEILLKAIEDNELSMSVKVQLSEPLKKDDNLTLFAQVVGGSEFYVTSNQQNRNQIVNQKALFGFTTLGKENDGNNQYLIIVGITKEKLSTGQRISTLPDDLICQNSILVKKYGNISIRQE
jgi:hypothetical protein